MSGPERSYVELTLNTLGDRIWEMKFVVELIQCPPGFKPTKGNGNKTVCECSPSMYGGRVLCNLNTLKVRMDVNYWMGFSEDEGEYLVGSCPPGFCASSDASSYIFLPNTSAALSGVVCNTNRTGVMCGECTNGSGPAVNSATFDCVWCDDTKVHENIITYLASIYVPLAALFTLLIVFDIRLTTGPANAFIIYSQVISSTFIDGQNFINTPSNNNISNYDSVAKVYKMIYGLFNLEFIENLLEPFCLHSEFNALTVLSLDYGVALFPLIIITLILIHFKLKECCPISIKPERLKRIRAFKCWRRRSISETLLPAFAGFILLSYTKFCLTSSLIFAAQSLICENGSDSPSKISRVYYAGKFDTTDPEYVYSYLLPSTLIFAIFVCIPPLLLLVYPLKIFEWCLSKVTCLWKFYPVDKVHVFLDTFQGCYKNNMRFFAGLYFLFRLVISSFYFAHFSWLEKFVGQQIICIAMVTLVSTCQPYNAENRLLNYIDPLIFTNLAVINALSLLFYTLSLINQPLPPFALVFQQILIFLPLVYMIGYIIWYFLFFRFKCLKKREKESDLIDNNNDEEMERAHTRSEIEEDEALFARAELSNHYQKPRDHYDSFAHIHDSNRITDSERRKGEKTDARSSQMIDSHYGTMSSITTQSSM